MFLGLYTVLQIYHIPLPKCHTVRLPGTIYLDNILITVYYHRAIKLHLNLTVHLVFQMNENK